MSETEPRCSTPCDDDCEAVCHEDHVPGHKKAHWPYDCPATERYGWGGSDFIAAAVKRLRGERDAATERAEQAEAALAEMRERLGEPVAQWAVMLDDTESSPLPEKVARRMASDPFRTTLLTRDIYPNTAWCPADAAPRTVLERAADEQGVRCGAECGEGHTYEPGSCEAAIDPDEAIARNHADAKRDWGIAEQGDGEGGGDA